MEVRHVDTGQLVQVIPGNNLRCLFADTPPSTTNSAANYYGGGRGNPYARQQQQQQQQQGYPGMSPNGYPYGGRGGGYARDEIIIVSEDRVMAVRLALGMGLVRMPDSDRMSMSSM